ncbi:hybrid sensor histidine kinase/response regulator [Piscinibacter sp. HJYY11]|nr:hybrid sensor histidine kinase/response regulator [Piscinibacter sp. HJYY11]
MLDDQASAERVSDIYAYLPITTVAMVVGVVVTVAQYWTLVPRAGMVAWLIALGLLGVARSLMYRGFKKRRSNDRESLLRWYQAWRATTLVAGCLWGLAAWFFFPYGGAAEQLTLILTIYSYCMAGMQILSPQHNTFYEFCALCLTPLVVRVALPGDTANLMLAGYLLVIFGITIMLARLYRKNNEGLVQIKVRLDQLTLQLRAEKAAAEAARQEAEVANRAKTQFFAAASHDLRQPLHAMGLFAEALRQRSHDEEVTQLVASINGSVDALEGLFSELLDITRIDTGGVDVTPEHFNVGDIFRKLRLHFEPVAFEKGLALRFRGAQHNLYADPVLVERILRNLVSNAIRYTNDGTVLVSCRRRNGRMLLQVWDTGVGIREREQEHIFEEFYQVPYSESLTPQQRKGLGLGLAIVKRLAGLMQAPLRLRSQPGRGSVFSLEFPPGKAPRVREPSDVRGKLPIGLTLDRRFIVVVEDEPAVRGGLEVLLRGWGARVLSFETAQEARAWAQHADLANELPDLLIVDYRLEQGHTGIEVIQAMRSRFGQGVPAIMVTGSTMTQHDSEAAEHDFHLLIKPVVPNKLRAMIGFKLGVRSGSA